MTTLSAQLKIGLYMATQSFSMLWHQKKLLFYFSVPALFSFALQLILFNMQLPASLATATQSMGTTFSALPYFIQFLANFIAVYIPTTIMIFFTVALMHHSAHAMHGQHTTIKESLKMCTHKIVPVLLWSLPATFIEYAAALLFEKINQNQATSSLVVFLSVGIGILVLAWLVYTFFVLPLITFKHLNLFENIAHSGTISRYTITQIVGGELWFFVVITLVCMPLIVVWLLSQQVVLTPMQRFMGLFILQIIVRAFISTAHAIFKIILYTYYLKHHAQEKERDAHFPKYF